MPLGYELPKVILEINPRLLVHLSSHANGCWKDDDLFFWKVELFGVLGGIGGALALGLGLGHCEKLVVVLAVEEDRALFKADDALATLVHFLGKIPVGFDMHYFFREIHDVLLLFYFLFDNVLEFVIVHVGLEVPCQNSYHVLVIFVEAWKHWPITNLKPSLAALLSRNICLSILPRYSRLYGPLPTQPRHISKPIGTVLHARGSSDF